MKVDERLDDYLLPETIRLQPATIDRVLREADPLIESIAKTVIDREPRDIVMTGCGDSLFSSMAAA